MAGVHLQFDGLQEFKDALRSLPKDLADDGKQHVDDTTEITASRLIQSYPLGDTGNLRRGVRRSTQMGAFGAIGIVKSTSPHAHLWEWGTQSRRTKQGWERGKSPAHFNQGLVGISIQERRRLNNKLVDLVKQAGFQVQGSF